MIFAVTQDALFIFIVVITVRPTHLIILIIFVDTIITFVDTIIFIVVTTVFVDLDLYI
jgi:hypothetical protein